MAADLAVETDVSSQLPRVLTLTPADLGDLVTELAWYHARYAPLFQRREQRESSEIYLKGLLVADVARKNVEAMVLRLSGAGQEAENRVRALQQFIGEGKWDDKVILAEHWRLVDESLGEEDGVLILDGSDIPKQGTHSAGVARQWCGATGKKDNCQAGVFLGYASRKGYTLLDRQLYLPEQWFGEEYGDRWRKAQIPEATPFRTKPELAAEMVEALMKDRPLRARWMVCDEGYGNDPQILDRIAATGLHYLAEVSKDTMVWPILEPDGKTLRAQPKTYVKPPPPSGRGRPPVRKRLDPESPSKMRVDELAEKLTDDQWHRYRILEGAKGPLVADFAAVRATAPRQRIPGPEIWVVIRRKVMGPEEEPKLKFYLSQAPAATPLEEMVRVSGMRWPIESCFAEGKGELGLDQYELRFYAGWHHHMTMVILAHHFLVLMQQHLGQRGGLGAKGSEGTGDPTKEYGMPGSAGRVGGTGTGGGDPTEHGRGEDAAASHPAAA